MLAFAPAPSAAGSLEIGPIRVQMIGSERTATLTIRNTDATPVTVQIRTVDWTQPGGADVYTPSSVLMVSPPLVTLAPGESQVVRLVLEHVPEASTERAFRLIVDEIPASASGLPAGVMTALRVLVPVFVTPSTESRSRLRWEAKQEGESLTVTAINEGAARERLINMQVSNAGQPVGEPLEGYVLSGGRRTWTIDTAGAAATALTVSAEGEYGTVEANVPVTP
ncbi:molecular chaperone [Brevundimonas sp. Root1423]|uniref:fimbrial biogenesis chaperone n=1 Tax=Brevundimonas sp. Root1423 TaxID=1736462 RepID=UPI00138F2C05|nr:fimbria/pilus periplasmic chaperone [Brevundimonas sp. Root1423]